MSALKERWLDVERHVVALIERLVPGQKQDLAEETPSPWAVAVAVLALLGFGVLVGTTVSPAQGGSSALILPRSSVTQTAGSGASATTPPPTKPEATPSASSESESESESEGSEESGKEAGAEEAAKSSGSAGK